MLSTPPLAPKNIAALAACGIRTADDLRCTGAPAAFALLKKSGLGVTESVLWQLAALCEGTDVRQLDSTRRTLLREAVRQLPPVAPFPPQDQMQGMMREALAQAQLAEAAGEVPVGAVIVRQGEIIARAHNRCIGCHTVGAHAEMQAVAAAGAHLGSYRLDGCDLYVTLEPCSMCAGALIQSRISRLIYGAAEPRTGAAGSVLNLFANKTLNSHTAVLGGVLAEASQELLHRFFAKRRKTKAA